MNIAGSTNDPITVTTGEIDGLEAFMKPPTAKRAPKIKQTIEETLTIGSSKF